LIKSAAEPAPPRLDRAGVLLTCTGLAALTYTAHLLSESNTSWALAGVVGAAALLLLGAASWHLLRTDAPLVNLRTLRVHTFGAAIGGSSLFWIAVGAAPFLLSLLFQNVFGWSPIKSGAIVLFVFVGNIAIKPATTSMLNHFGFRKVLLAATPVLAATMLAAGFFTASTPLAVIAAILLLSGVARSVGFTAYTTMAFSDIGARQMRDANTLASMMQQLSMGLGVAAASVALRIGTPLGRALAGHPTAATAYTVAFALLALVALLPVIGAVRLHPGAGDALRSPAKARGAARAG
jgi:hypothetical protein